MRFFEQWHLKSGSNMLEVRRDSKLPLFCNIYQTRTDKP